MTVAKELTITFFSDDVTIDMTGYRLQSFVCSTPAMSAVQHRVNNVKLQSIVQRQLQKQTRQVLHASAKQVSVFLKNPAMYVYVTI